MKNSKFVKALLVASVLVSSASIANAAEGETIFKARLLGSFPVKSTSSFSGPVFATGGIVGPVKTNSAKLTKNGFGGDVSGTYFFTNNFASELSVGLIYSKNNVANVKSSGLTANGKKVWTVPVTLTAQYHPLAGSQFSPYVGAGIAYIYNSNPKGTTATLAANSLATGFTTPGTTGSTNLATLSLSAPKGFAGVLQAGFDVSATDGIGFNLDIKKYFMKNKKSTATFYSNAAGTAGLTTTALGNTVNTISEDKKFSPLVISAGVSFKF